MGRKLNSEFLIADSRETASDIFVSIGLLVALYFIERGHLWVDGGVAILISLVVLRNSLKIFQEATSILSDEAVLDPKAIEQAVMSHAEARFCHAVRSRGKPDAIYVDLHLGVDAKVTVEESHDRLSHEVKQILADRFPGVKCVLIHVEPDTKSARNRSNSIFRFRDF